MSRVGKMPIAVPDGVKVEMQGKSITVTGPKGVLSRELHPEVKVEITEGEILVSNFSEEHFHRSLHGLTRTLIANMVKGTTEGFQKVLDIVGVGYRAAMKGNDLEILVGYSHPVPYPAPQGIEFEVPQPTRIIIKGINKEQVGQVAAEIRAKRPPEPYKGKGIRYSDEKVRRKVGKAGK